RAVECGGWRRAGHWTPGSEYGSVRVGPAAGAGGDGSGGGTVSGGRGTGARLSGAGGVDGGEVCAASVCTGSGGAAVPHWRSGALSRRWRTGVSGAAGRAGEGAGLPDRVGRDRERAATA